MKEEVEILSRELEKQCKAVEYHVAQIRHVLQQLHVQLESKKPVAIKPVETRCECE